MAPTAHHRDRPDPTDDSGTVVPLRRPAHRQHGIRVERIDTTPMTAEQYDRAVAALAALINEWHSNAGNRGEFGEHAA
ncbi:hypothetical protein ACGF5S_06780 [Nocardia nova]|uniref:hypothetical protein n=1 Tax=Nocardia nova TaxID=37330 RepID=UPI0037104A5D